MKTIDYIGMLKQSWEITWKNKFLWLFGFFVLLGSVPANVNLNADKLSGQSEQFQVIMSFAREHMAIVLIASVVFFVLAISFYALKIMSTAALIKSANNIVVFKQSAATAILSGCRKYFWLLVLTELIINVAMGIIIFVLLIPILYMASVKAIIPAVISSLFAVIIFVPLVFLAYFVKKYAYMYVVVGNFGLRNSLEASYNLLRANLKESLLAGVWVVLSEIAFSMSILVTIGLLVLVMFPFGALAYILLAKTGLAIIGAVVALAAMVVAIVGFSALVAFSQTVWVLFFKQIAFEKHEDTKEDEKELASVEVPKPEAA